MITNKLKVNDTPVDLHFREEDLEEIRNWIVQTNYDKPYIYVFVPTTNGGGKEEVVETTNAAALDLTFAECFGEEYKQVD